MSNSPHPSLILEYTITFKSPTHSFAVPDGLDPLRTPPGPDEVRRLVSSVSAVPSHSCRCRLRLGLWERLEQRTTGGRSRMGERCRCSAGEGIFIRSKTQANGVDGNVRMKVDYLIHHSMQLQGNHVASTTRRISS